MSAPFQVLRLLLCVLLFPRPFFVSFKLRPDRGLFFAAFFVCLNRFCKVNKGNLFPGFYLCFQFVNGRGVVDDTVKAVVILLDCVLNVL